MVTVGGVEPFPPAPTPQSVSELGPSGTNNPYTSPNPPEQVPPVFGPPTSASLGPLAPKPGPPLEQTPAGVGLQGGWDAFRQAFVVQLPSAGSQIGILAHRGIGG